MKFTRGDDKTITIKPKSHLRTNDAQALYRLARSGAGLAVVPQFLMEQDILDGNVQHLLPEWKSPSVDVFAVWPSNAPKHGLIHLALNSLNKNKKRKATFEDS